MPANLVTYDHLRVAVMLSELGSPLSRAEARTALSYWISGSEGDKPITEFVTPDRVSDVPALITNIEESLSWFKPTDDAYSELHAALRWVRFNRDTLAGIVRGKEEHDDECPGCECGDDPARTYGGPCAHCRMH